MTWTITATAQSSNVPPRASVTVTTTDGTTSCTVMRNNADGSQSATRTTTGSVLQLPGGSGQFYDYEPWFGQASTWTVLEGGVTSAAVTVTASRPWLIVPGQPTLSWPISRFGAGSFDTVTNALTVGSSEVAGRATPVDVSDGQRKSDAGAFTILTQTAADQASLEKALASGMPLLLNVPPSLGFYDVPTAYISVRDVTHKRVTGVLQGADMLWTLPYRVVSQPVGGVIPQKSYADIIATYPDYAAIAALGDYSKLL